MSTDGGRNDRLRAPAAPLIWELPVLFVTLVLTVAVLTPLVVQAVVCALLTGTLAWPHGQLGAALLALGHGHFGAGLPDAAATTLPADPVLWAATALAEPLVLGGLALLGWRSRELLGLGDPRGLSSSTRTSAALGIRRLRRQAPVVRPDLADQRPPGRTPGRTARLRRMRWAADEVGWRLGRTGRHGAELWVPYDRTTCVIGPQGSGKTLDLLAPALLHAPGAALVTLTKPDDLFLTLQARLREGRPVAVLDPFDLAPGTPELLWDPISGCEDAMIAERRAKAFSAGTIHGAATATGDQAARFYAGECAKVLQAYFHAAAVAGLGLEEVLTWVAGPLQHPQAEEILRTHPGAEPLWDGLLRGALKGDPRTAGNTITTVQQALGLFFQGSIRRRCVPGPGRPATDLTELIEAGGTVYLLGREDPYASATPLMTAVTEHILDTAKRLGETAPHGRLCPPFLACLDELPSTAPIPTLATRMANERALGVSFLLAAQTWRQIVLCYGEHEARTLYGLSNNLVVFGGGKDIGFYQELSDLIGDTTVSRVSYSRGNGETTRSWNLDEVPVLQAGELRRIPQRHAVVLSAEHEPVIARLDRCIDGPEGRKLLVAQQRSRRASRDAAGTRDRAASQPGHPPPEDLTQTRRRLGLPQ